MNILFIKHFFVGFMVYEIPIVSVFGYFPQIIYIFTNIINNYNIYIYIYIFIYVMIIYIIIIILLYL